MRQAAHAEARIADGSAGRPGSRGGWHSMNDAERRHRASVLLLIGSVLWWHRWIPALLVAGVVSWAILHRWLEGDLGAALGRRWRRVWPPSTIVLIPLLSGAAL